MTMTETADSYRVDFDHLTVVRTEATGEDFDLNAEGEPCQTMRQLRGFVIELFEQGAYPTAVRVELSRAIDLEEGIREENKADLMSPADLFRLEFLARVTVQGQEWVVYSDGAYRHAILADDWDGEIEALDTDGVDDETRAEIESDAYSLWCVGTTCADDEDLCVEIAVAAELTHIHAGGTCGRCDAPD